MSPWLEQFREPSLTVIRQNEAFLAEYGVIPNAGQEHELYAVWKKDAQGNFIRTLLPEEAIMAEFKDNPYVEKFEKIGEGSYELVIGRQKSSRKTYPHPTLKPSDIATESEKGLQALSQILSKDVYNVEGIALDGGILGRKPCGQHSNISLWLADTSLFSNGDKNEFTVFCIKSLLETQHALIALAIPSANSFKRFNAPNTRGIQYATKSILLGNNKKESGSIIIRNAIDHHTVPPVSSHYLEDRLCGSDVPPYLGMLITTTGVVRGGKTLSRKAHYKK